LHRFSWNLASVYVAFKQQQFYDTFPDRGLGAGLMDCSHIRRWGKIWGFVGIVGTAPFVVIWVLTRVPDNPITGRGGRKGDTAVILEALQIAVIIILGIIVRL